MMINGLFRKTVIPLAMVALLISAFYPVCTKNGQCDYFLLWIMVGWPFGIGKMFVWIVPKNFGLAGSLGAFALNIIIGGLIGGVVVCIKVILAIANIVFIFGKGILKAILPSFRTSCL